MVQFITIKLKFKTLFSKNNIKTLKNLLDLIGIKKKDLKQISQKDLEKKINENLRPKVKSFGERKVKVLAEMLLEETPKEISYKEVLLQENEDEEAIVIQNELSKHQEIEVETDEDGIVLEETSVYFPVKTLFLGSSIIKGETPFVLIEDCLISSEDEIDEDLFEDDPFHSYSNSLLELYRFIQREGWPSESPICISKGMQEVAPMLVIELSKIADLIIK